MSLGTQHVLNVIDGCSGELRVPPCHCRHFGGVHSALADGTPLLVELEELRPRLHGASERATWQCNGGPNNRRHDWPTQARAAAQRSGPRSVRVPRGTEARGRMNLREQDGLGREAEHVHLLHGLELRADDLLGTRSACSSQHAPSATHNVRVATRSMPKVPSVLWELKGVPGRSQPPRCPLRISLPHSSNA